MSRYELRTHPWTLKYNINCMSKISKNNFWAQSAIKNIEWQTKFELILQHLIQFLCKCTTVRIISNFRSRHVHIWYQPLVCSRTIYKQSNLLKPTFQKHSSIKHSATRKSQSLPLLLCKFIAKVLIFQKVNFICHEIFVDIVL